MSTWVRLPLRPLYNKHMGVTWIRGVEEVNTLSTII